MFIFRLVIMLRTCKVIILFIFIFISDLYSSSFRIHIILILILILIILFLSSLSASSLQVELNLSHVCNRANCWVVSGWLNISVFMHGATITGFIDPQAR